MLSRRKCISFFVFAMVTLLSCSSPASSLSILPRISRTDDAIIVDFADQETAAPHQGKNLYGGNANPLFNPYSLPQKPKFYNGWSYYYAYPSYTPATKGTLSNWQYGVEGERQAVKQGVTTTTTTPAPVIQCGRGPAIFPKTAKSFDDPFQPSISGKLAGGTDAKKDAWPFAAIIREQGNPICVGTLISESKVLLAAQCLEQTSAHNFGFMTVSFGVQSLFPSVLAARMTRRISKFVFHSQYDGITFANDIAIVTLEWPVSFSKNVAPVCLPPASTDPSQYVDQSAIVLGVEDSPKIQQGKVSIVSNDECKMMPTISQYVSDTTICINSETVFTCKKDIGGPVVVMSSPGTWTLVGINSYTASTCTSSGLKTSVSAFRSWIDQNMKI